MRSRRMLSGLTAAAALAAVAVLISFAPRRGEPAQAAGNLTVDGSQRYQTISGWGVNANPKNWGNAAYPALGPGLDLLVHDLGATLFRVDVYGTSNWEATDQNPDPAQYNWAYYNNLYGTDPAFVALWATLRHLNGLGISPILSASGVVPDWLGTDVINNDDAFVNMFASLVYYARNTAGIQFSVVDPLNEPDIGLNSPEGPYVPAAQLDAILSKLRAALVGLGMGDVQVLGPETRAPDGTYDGALLGDASVAPFLRALSAHNYGPWDLTFYVNQVAGSGYPGTPYWMTEYSSNLYGQLDNGTQVPDEWAFTAAMTQNLFSYLTTGANAALVWDAYDNVHDHSGSYTYWGLLNTLAGYVPRTRYYGAKQVFAYVKPGSVRIAASTAISGVQVLAFTNDATGALTIVGMNTNASPQQISGSIANVQMPSALSLYQTTASLNGAFGGSVPVSGGSFSATVAANSIFTLTAPSCASCPTPTATNTALPATATSTAAAGTVTPTPTATWPGFIFSTPTANTSVTFGRTDPTGVNDSSDVGHYNGTRAQLSTPGRLTSLSIYIGATSTNAHVRLALYAADGSGNPATLVAQTVPAVTAPGWNTLATPPTLIPGGTYWILAETDDPSTLYRVASALPVPSMAGWSIGAVTFGTFPAALSGAWTQSAGSAYAMYGTVATSGSVGGVASIPDVAARKSGGTGAGIWLAVAIGLAAAGAAAGYGVVRLRRRRAGTASGGF